MDRLNDLTDTVVKDVTDAIIAAHPAISGAFFTGIGHLCQFRESQILVEVLRILVWLGITALPIHDAIIVPASAAAKAQRVMLHTFKVKTGQDGVVDIISKPKHREELLLVA
jgi:hypothetical protein